MIRGCFVRFVVCWWFEMFLLRSLWSCWSYCCPCLWPENLLESSRSIYDFDRHELWTLRSSYDQIGEENIEKCYNIIRRPSPELGRDAIWRLWLLQPWVSFFKAIGGYHQYHDNKCWVTACWNCVTTDWKILHLRHAPLTRDQLCRMYEDFEKSVARNWALSIPHRGTGMWKLFSADLVTQSRNAHWNRNLLSRTS